MAPLWYRREIFEGDEGPDVNVVRRKLNLYPEGPFDRACIERLTYMARRKVESVDADMADMLGESEANMAGLSPEWFTRPLERGDVGEDVRSLRKALGVWDDNRYEHDCEAAVRRFQSANNLIPDGKVDEQLARMIGEA